jgi:hypothetical protein
VRAKDIVAGGIYWHAPSKDWLDYDAYATYAVRIDDPQTRYHKPSYSFRGGHYEHPGGKFLKGTVVALEDQEIGGTRDAGQTVYVLPQSLRGEAIATVTMIQERRAAKRAATEARRTAAEETALRGEEIKRKLAVLGVQAEVVVTSRGILSVRLDETGANRLLTLRTETEA